MEWGFLVAYLVLASTRSTAGVSLTSCGDKERIISLDESITPPSSIYGSGHFFENHAVTNVLNFGFPGQDLETFTWCTSSTEDLNPFVGIRFSNHSVLTGMISSGNRVDTGRFGVDIQTYMVTNFTLDFQERDGTFVNYSTANQSPKYLESPEPVTFIKFEEPIVTRDIRLRPVDWSTTDGSEYICQGVAIFGCLLTEVIDSPSTEQTTNTEATTMTQPETTNTVQTTETTTGIAISTGLENTQADTVIRGNQSLAVALPISILTILIVAIIVSVGVGLCLFIRKQYPKQILSAKYHNKGSLAASTHSNIELLEESVKLETHARSGTIRVAENTLYGDPENSKSHPGEDTTSADDAYEPVIPISEEDLEKRERNDSMVDNLVYSSVFDNPQYQAATNTNANNNEFNIDMEINRSYHSLVMNNMDTEQATATTEHIQAEDNLYEDM